MALMDFLHRHIRCKELDTMIPIPPAPFVGRNKAHAWERGFERRAWGGRESYSASPYSRANLTDCWQQGWKAADEAIRLLTPPQAP
jgi:hypothetical protein